MRRDNRYMSGHDDYTEDDYIDYITDWRIQQQFMRIEEIVDKHVSIKRDDSGGIYTTHFVVRGIKYVFSANGVDGDYGILFHDMSGRDVMDTFYPRLNDRHFVGEVYSGVFISLKSLIRDRDVVSFHFNTDDAKLISLYDKMVRYIEDRFDYKLQNRDTKGKYVQWVYSRK